MGLLMTHPKLSPAPVGEALLQNYELHPRYRVDLFHQDCYRGMADMIESQVFADVIVTSPPYNLDKEYAGYDDNLPEQVYLDWLKTVIVRASRVLASDGSFFLNLAGPPSDPLKPWRILQACVLPELSVQNVFHWVKHWSLADEPTTGHCTPINSDRFVNNGHEYVFHLTWKREVKLDKLALGVPYADKSNLTRGTRGKHGDVRDRGNVWMIPYETIQRRATDRPHPATFPVELVTRCLKLHGLGKIRRVLDPFMGIGTTAVACARLGKSCVGFEVCEAYFEEAGTRLHREMEALRRERA